MNTRSALHAPLPLPPELVESLYRFNPWWQGASAPDVPHTRRHFVGQVRQRLEFGITPSVAVPGPRGVGKTTMQLQIIRDLLDEGVPPHHIAHVRFDQITTTEGMLDPILRITSWIERNITPATFNALAHQGRTAYLFFDEVQHIRNWSNQLKFLVDNSAVKVVATGSSALHIEPGRDSLAGRMSTVAAGVLSLTEIAELRGVPHPEPFLPENNFGLLHRREFWQELAQHGRNHARFRDETFRLFSHRGAYPVAHQPADAPQWFIDQRLNEDITERVLRHDLPALSGGQPQNAGLLRALLRFACRYAGQAPSYATLAQDARDYLGADVNAQQVHDYLRALDDTTLIRLIPPLEMRLRRPTGGDKICLADHSLRNSRLPGRVPLDPESLAQNPELATLAGHLAESTFGTTASLVNSLEVSHQPAGARIPEADFVLTVGDQRIPVEIKYQRRIDARDTAGLRAFMERTVNRAPFGLLISREETPDLNVPKVVAMPLSTLMLLA